jgi:hypothetical protein
MKRDTQTHHIKAYNTIDYVKVELLHISSMYYSYKSFEAKRLL